MPVTVGLGTPAETAQRLAKVLDELADPTTGRARVPLGELGAAVCEPLGPDVFDEEDRDDRTVLVEVLRSLAPILAAGGWTLGGSIPACPPGDHLVSWRRHTVASVLPRQGWAELAVAPSTVCRWRRRARAEGIERGSGQPLPVVSAPPPSLPVRAELTVLGGCAAGASSRERRRQVQCAPAPGGRLRCSTCGAVTVLVERIVGPRLPGCECLGDAPICAHPIARSPAPPLVSRPSARRASRAELPRSRRSVP